MSGRCGLQPKRAAVATPVSGRSGWPWRALLYMAASCKAAQKPLPHCNCLAAAGGHRAGGSSHAGQHHCGGWRARGTVSLARHSQPAPALWGAAPACRTHLRAPRSCCGCGAAMHRHGCMLPHAAGERSEARRSHPQWVFRPRCIVCIAELWSSLPVTPASPPQTGGAT